MLTKWHLENFKSVREPVEVELRALTLFAGANSSGKSTLLQSMLLLQQTITHPIHTKALVINGRLLRLGSFAEISNNKSPHNAEIGFGFDYRLDALTAPAVHRQSLVRVSGDFKFIPALDLGAPEIVSLQARLKSARIEAEDDDGDTESIEVFLSPISPDARAAEAGVNVDSISDDDRQMLRYEVRGVGDDEEHHYLGARLFHFLPVVLAFLYDKTASRAEGMVNHLTKTQRFSLQRTSTRREIPDSLRDAFFHVTQAYVEKQPPRRRELERALGSGEPPDVIASQLLRLGGTDFRIYLEQQRSLLVRAARGDAASEWVLGTAQSPMSEADSKIREIFTEKLRYLGPLRDEPKPFYPLESAADPTDLGIRGEYTAAVLHLNKDRIIQYVNTADYLTQRRQARLSSATLRVAVIDWLTYMEIVTNVETTDREVFGHELRVATEGGSQSHTLVHVGVGVSQVLPILVLALIAPAGSVLIFEQPELHLHPRVQARLGDFFLAMTRAGKQCIVETHSEYLVNRVRLRVAEDEGDATLDSVALYNVEKVSGYSEYNSVALNEFGAISDWPAGFFDHLPGESERILRAAMKKRQRRRGAD